MMSAQNPRLEDTLFIRLVLLQWMKTMLSSIMPFGKDQMSSSSTPGSHSEEKGLQSIEVKYIQSKPKPHSMVLSTRTQHGFYVAKFEV